ncbi:hypothetical protein [Synoicihabitans lomoniglobus]|uniref:Uncharacterized protein n=1 Tax=Synoicihabitans lomoniglobus TaxID=2909285 RepID=A0AAE9ZUH9_9BACT|nr:hypothetical protein [Opitutaceae bacterium LMO-M01]WED64546.1 hypothetical protein PXH66_19570 [Opitutaceae bacterium LMO-M01]
MKRAWFALAVICLASTMRGYPPPDSVAGDVYVRTTSSRGLVIKKAYLLAADGTARGLWSISTQSGSFLTYDRVVDGTYHYEVSADGEVGELTLTLTDAAGSTVVGVDHLRFDSASGGDFAPQVGGLVRSTFLLCSWDSAAPLLNSSLRCVLSPGAIARAGFVVGPEGGWFLLRVVGATLSQFGVDDVVEKPEARLWLRGQILSEIGGWENDEFEAESLRRSAQAIGAFPLAEGAADAAQLIWLSSGPRVLEGRNAGATEGELLIEIYPFPARQ